MKVVGFAQVAAALLLMACVGCAAPEPAQDEAVAYLHPLGNFVAGVWEVDQELEHIPWFFQQGSSDDLQAEFNPPGLFPVRDTKPGKIRLIIFPPAIPDVSRESEVQPSILSSYGYLVARIETDGVLREYIRDYELEAQDGGTARLLLESVEYQVGIGQNDSLLLYPSGDVPGEPRSAHAPAANREQRRSKGLRHDVRIRRHVEQDARVGPAGEPRRDGLLHLQRREPAHEHQGLTRPEPRDLRIRRRPANDGSEGRRRPVDVPALKLRRVSGLPAHDHFGVVPRASLLQAVHVALKGS